MRYVGLDVHRSTVRVCVLDEAGKRVLGTTVPCSRESLVAFAKEKLLPDDRVALEATTNTWAVVDLLKPPVKQLCSVAGRRWLAALPLSAADRLLADGQLRLLESLDAELLSLDRELQKQAWEEDRAKLLMTLPGVGHGTALSLLAALGDVARFRDGDHAASYLGLTPSTRQSADRCYHGPITKAGSATTRWMLTQGVQHVAAHPGPLGVFFRRLSKRKNRNVAITAVARKLVTIAYLMLKNDEPYRYAQAKRVHEKFTGLRSTATGKVARGRPGSAPADLPAACDRHGLPPVRRFDELPAGERRMLKDRGLEPAVTAIHAQPAAPR